MRIVEIPSSFKNNTFDKLDIIILDKGYDSNIFITEDELYSLTDIEHDNKLIIYYIVHKIITDKNLDIKDIKTPRNGLAFRDLNTKNDLGIYHAHLKNNMVLIWYVVKDGDESYELRLEYINHPNDGYISILKNIYKLKDSFHLIKSDYLRNLLNLTYLNENKYILNFLDFIKLL